MSSERFFARACAGAVTALVIAGAVAGSVSAAPLLPLPGPAAPIGERQALLADVAVPVGPWKDGTIETIQTEGQLSQTAWRLDDTDLSSLEMMKALRAQLTARGYEVLYECRTRSCGGFDFRFNINVLPEPEMHVDLGDYRFLSARRTGADAAQAEGADAGDYVTLMVSRSFDAGFVQITHVAPPATIAATPVLSTRSADAVTAEAMTGMRGFAANWPGADYLAALPGEAAPFSAEIERGGAIALEDLTFETGSARLGPGPFPSLRALADYLLRNPGHRVTLVGHSDAVGGLDQNMTLSRQRAEAVMAVLARDYGVPKSQIDAAGVGFLAPRASNLTDDGRSQNRRVEVVLTAVE